MGCIPAGAVSQAVKSGGLGASPGGRGADGGLQPCSRLLSEPWTPTSCCWNRPGEGSPGEALHSQELSA